MELLSGNELNMNVQYSSEHELYGKVLNIINVIDDWCLSSTQIQILVYIIRLGFNKESKARICSDLGISFSSLNTNLTYLRKGKAGSKIIKKLLRTSDSNENITLINDELVMLKKLVSSGPVCLSVNF